MLVFESYITAYEKLLKLITLDKLDNFDACLSFCVFVFFAALHLTFICMYQTSHDCMNLYVLYVAAQAARRKSG